MHDRLTLITNLTFVTFGGVRLNAHAVLVENGGPGLFGDMHQIRGFSVCGASPVFDMRFKDPIDFDLVDGEGNVHQLRDDGEMRPLFSGAIMMCNDGRELQLLAEDSTAALDVRDFDEITEVWRVLPQLVAKFWRAPNMPRLQWVEAALLRCGLGSE